jgi:hypothetical protein
MSSTESDTHTHTRDIREYRYNRTLMFFYKNISENVSSRKQVAMTLTREFRIDEMKQVISI